MLHCDLSQQEQHRRKEIAEHTRQMLLTELPIDSQDETSIMGRYRDYYLQISFSELHPLMVVCLAKALTHPGTAKQCRIANDLNLRSVLGSHAINDEVGCYSYAEYRSRQLIRNFAHDTNDERAAATALQYGEYVDPSVYGGSGEPYYRANASEAIAKAGYVGTVDEVAYRLATLVRNSAEHWCYIGSAEYGYIAVGVTYESGMWYCDIAVTAENTDNL